MKELSEHGLPGYSIDKEGNVISPKGRRVKTSKNNKGYQVIRTSEFQPDGKRKQREYPLHRLLALVFIPNPFGCKNVQSIDGDAGNYSLSNLRWSGRSTVVGPEAAWVSETWELDYPYAHLLGDFIRKPFSHRGGRK